MHFKVRRERIDNELTEKVKSKQKDNKRLWRDRMKTLSVYKYMEIPDGLHF